jgi:hypothetical protein
VIALKQVEFLPTVFQPQHSSLVIKSLILSMNNMSPEIDQTATTPLLLFLKGIGSLTPKIEVVNDATPA